MNNIKQFIVGHKRVSIAALIGIVVVGYWFFHGSSTSAQTKYVLGTVTKGTLTVSMSGTGQIESSDQIDVKPKASAEITAVTVTAGQSVKAGQVLAYLDASDAQQSVRNAQIALDNATITLKKLQQNQAVDSANTVSDLQQAYTDTFNQTANAFLKLPSIIDTAHGVLFDDTLKGGCSPNSCEYGNLVSDDVHSELLQAVARATGDYNATRAAYDATFTDYRAMRTDAPSDQIVAILNATQRVITLLSQTVKSEQNLLDLVVDNIKTQAAKTNVTARIPSQVTSYQTAIGSAMSDLNSINSQLVSTQRSITKAQQTLDNAVLSNPLDLASQQNTVAQRTDDVRNAQRALAEHTIRAPIAGTVAKVNVKRGDTASSGTAIATIISTKQLAVISLNEVDVTKVQIGQKTTMTLDAVDGLTLTGTVAEVDSIGTTSQGVVGYNVTIALDTQDARIRPGMSVSTNVITQAVQNALFVPSAAVKTQNGTSFVQAIDGATPEQAASIAGFVSATAPRQIEVQVGVSNDSMTQILSGVQEGDTIVARTISASSTTAKTTGSVLTGGGSMRALDR